MMKKEKEMIENMTQEELDKNDEDLEKEEEAKAEAYRRFIDRRPPKFEELQRQKAINPLDDTKKELVMHWMNIGEAAE